MIEKPALSEFMIRNIPLSAALDALKRWDDLTDEELQRLGFAPAASEIGCRSAIRFRCASIFSRYMAIYSRACGTRWSKYPSGTNGVLVISSRLLRLASSVDIFPPLYFFRFRMPSTAWLGASGLVFVPGHFFFRRVVLSPSIARPATA